MPKSAQDKILDAYINHSIDLERLSEDMRQKIMLNLERVKKELTEKLLTTDLTVYNRRKLNKLYKAVNESLNSDFKDLSSLSNEYMQDVSEIEPAFVNDSFNKVLKTSYFSKSLNPALLKELTTNSLIQGAPNAEWWKRMNTKLQNKFADEIRLGITQGESLNEIVQRIRGKATGRYTTYLDASGKRKRWQEFKGGIMDITTREAEAFSRTALQTVSNNVREKMFEKYPNVIKGKIQNSTLDNRTTIHCMTYSNSTWTLENEAVGHSLTYVDLPAHWNCRSNWLPWMRAWDKIDKRITTQFGKGTQSSMDGLVSGDLSYEDWFKTKSKAFQLEKLGKGKFKLYNDGKLRFRDLVDQKGNPVSVRELKLKYA